MASNKPVSERGLPTVPRGLTRELTTFLQALLQVLASLAGLSQNSGSSRAVRMSESSKFGNNTIPQGSINAGMLADGSIHEKHIAGNSVSSDKLKVSSVTYDKLASDAKLTVMTGTASDQQRVNLGEWLDMPEVCLKSFSMALPQDVASVTVSVLGPYKVGDEYEFSVNCKAVAKDPDNNKSGGITWVAIGRRGA